jgi:predicted aconitase
MQTLDLAEFERSVPSDPAGRGRALAMKVMAAYAGAVGASHLIPITRAHVDGCLYQGESGIDFALMLATDGAQVAVPTTLNVGLVDLLHPELNRGDRDRIERGRALMRIYERLGCTPTWTCAPYQLADRPRFGEQVGWAESNAIVFINSVVGARTERYGDFIDICAAMLGVVPDHGLHRTANRRARVVFDASGLAPAWQASELFWPLLGTLVGTAAGRRVPVVTGVAGPVSEDSLKAFGAAAATTGSVALFHVAGVTPEAASLDDALQGEAPEEVVQVSPAMLRAARSELGTAGGGELAAVSIGTPHLSITEFEALVRLVGGRRCAPDVEFYVSTGRDVLAEVDRRGWLDPLHDFGAQVVVDTCTYLTPVLRRQRGDVVMTNSAKWAYYAPGNLGYKVVFASLGDCVSSAEAGRVALTDAGGPS